MATEKKVDGYYNVLSSSIQSLNNQIRMQTEINNSIIQAVESISTQIDILKKSIQELDSRIQKLEAGGETVSDV